MVALVPEPVRLTRAKSTAPRARGRGEATETSSPVRDSPISDHNRLRLALEIVRHVQALLRGAVRPTHFVRCIHLLAEAITLRPDRPQFYLIRGKCYCTLGLYQRALYDFSMALRLDSSSSASPRYFVGRAHCLRKLGRLSEALADCTEGLRVDRRINGFLAAAAVTANRVAGSKPEAPTSTDVSAQEGQTATRVALATATKGRLSGSRSTSALLRGTGAIPTTSASPAKTLQRCNSSAHATGRQGIGRREPPRAVSNPKARTRTPGAGGLAMYAAADSIIRAEKPGGGGRRGAERSRTSGEVAPRMGTIRNPASRRNSITGAAAILKTPTVRTCPSSEPEVAPTFSAWKSSAAPSSDLLFSRAQILADTDQGYQAIVGFTQALDQHRQAVAAAAASSLPAGLGSYSHNENAYSPCVMAAIPLPHHAFSARCLSKRAICHHRAGNAGAALRDLTEAQGLSPSDPEVAFLLGRPRSHEQPKIPPNLATGNSKNLLILLHGRITVQGTIKVKTDLAISRPRAVSWVGGMGFVEPYPQVLSFFTP
eukprot:GHVT01013090.1.p1 GENE.GHVT01013090.1~~GHVT01013090.1.p1  ORF type:complete len:542 (-),score=41.27 GHVT01013090.1:1187-2812(-)